MAAIALQLLGAALIAVMVRDVWHTLFHPYRGGSLSGALARSCWRALRALPARWASGLQLAGPVAMTVVIGAWTFLLAAGWALVFVAYMPDGFRFDAGIEPDPHRRWLDAAYVSLTALTTVGFGDITPTSGWIRLFTAVESALGFGLLSAAISWVLSTYVVIGRRRAFARTVQHAADADASGASLADADAHSRAASLERMAREIAIIRTDVHHFPISFYFWDDDDASSLALALSRALAAARDGIRDGSPDVRHHAARLLAALADFAVLLRKEFIRAARSDDLDEVLASYAREHRRGAAGAANRRALHEPMREVH